MAQWVSPRRSCVYLEQLGGVVNNNSSQNSELQVRERPCLKGISRRMLAEDTKQDIIPTPHHTQTHTTPQHSHNTPHIHHTIYTPQHT